MFLASSSPAATVSKGAPYLFTHHNAPAFRIRIPADLRSCLGKTEYRRSLGRCYAREAKLRALRLATAALEVFSFVREVLRVRKNSLFTQCLQLGATYEGETFSTGGSTPRRVSGEKSKVAQGQTTHEYGYTNLFQGRTLDSLTDDEIRSIAEATLLCALKGRQILSTEAGAEAFRRNLGSDQEDTEADTIMDEAEELLANDPTPTLPEEDVIGWAQLLAENCHKMKERLQLALISGKPDWYTASATERILKWNGISTDAETENAAALLATPPKASIPFVRAYNEMLKMSITDIKLEAQMALGEYDAYDTAVVGLEERQEQRREKWRAKVTAQPAAAVTPSISPAPEAEDSQSIKLSEAIEEMCREKTLDGSWKPKVAVGERHKLELLQAVIDPDGTLLVSAIGPKHLSRYKSMLYLMPASKGKKEAYRDMSLPELLHIVEVGEIPEKLRMGTNTIKTYCQSASAFINWASRQDYHHKPSITQLLRVKAEKQPHEFRDPYSEDDIARLFGPALYLTGGGRGSGKPSRFWVPLLGLFTGARLEELAQLHTDDLMLVNRQEDARSVFVAGQPVINMTAIREAEKNGETLCIFINKGKPYQRLKTASSRRYVPISSVLAYDLGFMSYAASVFQNAEQARFKGDNAPGDGRLFPELTRKKETDNFAHTISKWFNSYREKTGVVPQAGRGRKDFHSFRHTVARWCEQNEVPEKSAARFLGHSHDTMTFGRYGAETAAHKLHQRITAGFGEYLRGVLDIDGLKAGHWATLHP